MEEQKFKDVATDILTELGIGLSNEQIEGIILGTVTLEKAKIQEYFQENEG